MKPTLIFDVSQIGNAVKKAKWKTGLYRYSLELLTHLQKNEGVHLMFSLTDSPRTITLAKKFLRSRGFSQQFCNRRACLLPFNVSGRGERYFNRLYNTIGLDVDRMVYDSKMISRSHVFHSPNPPIPEKIKSFPRLKRIITIHDLIPLLDSDYEPEERAKMQKTLDSIGDDHAICVSRHTRNDLLNHCPGLDPDKVFVSHLAADPLKFYPCRDPLEFSRIKDKYGLPERYFLSLCTLEPRKNLDHLVRCFVDFSRQQNSPDLYLVLAGAVGWKTERIFYALDEAGDLRDRIVLTGRIADEDMAVLYSNAIAFFFVSMYEGFGLPPLEAMQCGAPVVTSNVSSLPEVVEQAGIMVSPTDSDALGQAMHLLVQDNSLRIQMKEKSIQQARKFSWEKTAQKHVDIYQTLLNH